MHLTILCIVDKLITFILFLSTDPLDIGQFKVLTCPRHNTKTKNEKITSTKIQFKDLKSNTYYITIRINILRIPLTT